ncbi:uncharacterized protein LOC122024756 isoform X2 [Zingiber officinale]|nr:uncharacterized protein LOC122024756 isoform X2 [Zingiber officinale]
MNKLEELWKNDEPQPVSLKYEDRDKYQFKAILDFDSDEEDNELSLPFAFRTRHKKDDHADNPHNKDGKGLGTSDNYGGSNDDYMGDSDEGYDYGDDDCLRGYL